jgi:hypothetical protein
MDRRTFLGGALVVAAASVVPVAAASMPKTAIPKLRGIGPQHDDWFAIDALLNGEPFIVGETPALIKTDRGRGVVLEGGEFWMSRNLRIRHACGQVIRRNIFRGIGEGWEYLFECGYGDEITLEHNTFFPTPLSVMQLNAMRIPHAEQFQCLGEI